MAKSITAYAKLTIPCGDAKDDEWEKAAKKQEVELVRCFARSGHVAQLDGERTRVGGEFEDPHFETTFQVSRDGVFDARLLEACEDFLNYSQAIDYDVRATLVLFCPDLFEERISCHLDPLETQNISWGNIHNNEFYNHWKVSFGPVSYNGNKATRNGKDPSIHKLMTKFEFDRPIPITVDFWTCDCLRSGQLQQAHHKVLVKGEYIQKVLIDVNNKTTKLYFVLTSPVEIRRKTISNGKHSFYKRYIELWWGAGKKEQARQAALTENLVFCVEFGCQLELYTIVSRLRHRLSVPIEFARLDEYRDSRPDLFERADGLAIHGYWTTKLPNGRNMAPYDVRDKLFGDFLKYAFPTPRGDARLVDKSNERKFSYVYLLLVLLSRGPVVKDQLTLYKYQWEKFLEIITRHVNDDEHHNLCESALEDLVDHVDRTAPNVGNLLRIFERFCDERLQTQQSNQLTKEMWDEGYRKVRKVVLTPTRSIFVVPETLMGNRALSGCDHDGTRVHRVTFRDDNGGPMRQNQMDRLLRVTLLRHLGDGFAIMGREFGFLGASNSQMRSGGAYFMERYSNHQLMEYRRLHNCDPPNHFKPKIQNERQKLGRFEEMESIPKAMARLGQCFTQARTFQGIDVGIDEYVMIPDTMGGKNKSGKPYVFTDGIGVISKRMAERIAQRIGYPPGHAPSAYQFRFRGMKGMLAIDPRLDQITDHFQIKYTCLFRDSQLKFASPTANKTAWPLELVKWSTPSVVTLNRPFINILDHVAAAQSAECHKRVSGRIEELFDMQLASFAKSMTNEASCRARLEDMPRRINFAALRQTSGFTLSTEPFFRSLIKAAVDVAIGKMIGKVQIQVPPSCGRTMFGVIDETGQLQYGQVFVKRTLNANSKSRISEPYTGRVLITKFPAVVSGDVRMFEAVDIAELHHLNDVVVFPQSGPQPHPDEMAGSDLDGDEYAVIWDPLLFFERNERAFEYCNDKPTIKFMPEEMDVKMHEFYADYMELDSVGHTSVNHLYQSDQYGLDSDVCNEIAKKNSMALDFSKSGVAPARLTRDWVYDEEASTWIPPEQSERLPDFSLCSNRHPTSPMYSSSRLLGTLYREMRSISDVVVSSTEKLIDVSVDALITYPGWERFRDQAERQLKSYNCRLRSILDYYGVGEEAEAFSGFFRSLRNRISDRDNDDMSMFNTERVIAIRVTELFRDARKQFFAEFHQRENAYMFCTEVDDPRGDPNEKDVLKRVCRVPTPDIMRKAVAYYRVCYEAAASSKDRKLSFGWLAYEVLNTVKSENIVELPRAQHPQLQAINEHRNSFIKDNQNSINRFKLMIAEVSSGTEEEAKTIVRAYLRRYPGLEQCLFVIDTWARTLGLLRSETEVVDGMREREIRKILKTAAASRLKWYHVSLLVILHATKEFGSVVETPPETHSEDLTILERISPNEATRRTDPLSASDLDALTLAFFHFLASRQFRRLTCLNFRPIGLSSVFMRGEWIGYHRAGTKTYYNLVMNMRFDDLPVSSDSILDKKSVLREGVPFLIELPKGFDLNEILAALRLKSNCTQIEARPIDGYCPSKECARLLISSRGTIEAVSELRELVSVSIPRYLSKLEKTTAFEMALLTHYKITGNKFQKSSIHSPNNTKP